jgi:ADP-dependent NAD(P)H-hydrate dehydratase / NAD(P)H-hydrate epimerase
MIDVLTPEQMRAVDAQAVASVGDDALMSDAGLRIAERLRAMLRPGGRVVAFAGPGNNGGDAFAALAMLEGQYERRVYVADADVGSNARREAARRARASGVEIRPLPLDDSEIARALRGAIGVDGLFGTGSRLPIAAPYAAIARALDARALPVLAIDIPSGIDALTGAASDDAVRATVTVTIGAAKPGLFLEPAREFVGECWYAPIGIDPALLAAQPRTFAALDDDAFVRLLPKRPPDGDKRTSGAPLIVAGSAQFPGAAVLCARGAARAGAGYVTVATSANVAPILRTHLIEQVVVDLSTDAPPEQVIDDLIDISRHNSSVAIGPGLGLDDRTGAIVTGFLERNELPVVVDASALFHLSKRLEILRGKKAVVTPHAGEFARLSGKGTIAPGQRVERLREFVSRTGIATLLKCSDTLIYDGSTMHINATGTSALATAGTGDVLSGIIATLASQGLPICEAAQAGAYWHGLAGRHAASIRPVGVVASDVVDALAAAVIGASTQRAFSELRRLF